MTDGRAVQAWVGGDCWLAPAMGSLDLRQIWGEGTPDILAVNLECAVSAGPARTGRRALLPLDASRLPELAIADKSVVICANNHITDYGGEGVLATLAAVRASGLLPVGAGANLDEARAPLIVTCKERTIGLLAYAHTDAHVGAVTATATAPGVAPLEPELIAADLVKLAPIVDDVWVFLHWGREHIRYPDPIQRSWAARFVGAGATAVIGCHPHIVQGWECVGAAPVYYSMGNLVFPAIPLADGPLFRWDVESRRGIALRAQLQPEGWSWMHIPYVIAAEGHPTRPDGHRKQSLLRSAESRCLSFSPSYCNAFVRLYRRERMSRAGRRLRMMSWRERIRLPLRCVRALRTRLLAAKEAP